MDYLYIDEETFVNLLTDEIKNAKRITNKNIYFNINTPLTGEYILSDNKLYFFNNKNYLGNFKTYRFKKIYNEYEKKYMDTISVLSELIKPIIKTIFETYDSTVFIDIVEVRVHKVIETHSMGESINMVLNMYIVKF